MRLQNLDGAGTYADVSLLACLGGRLAWLRREVWSSREAAPALGGDPQTRIVEMVEAKEY